MKYFVTAKYQGADQGYPIRRGQTFEGVMSFNLDSGEITFTIPLPFKPLIYTYPNCEQMLEEWQVLERHERNEKAS